MSFGAGFAMAAAIFGSSGSGGTGGDEPTEWNPPEHYPTLPESDDYEAHFVLNIESTEGYNNFLITRAPGMDNTDLTFYIDWGDETDIETFVCKSSDSNYNYGTTKSVFKTHTYSIAGMYVVKIYSDLNPFAIANFDSGGSSNRYNKIIMANLGDNVHIGKYGNYSLFYASAMDTTLRYVKFSGVFDSENETNIFRNCQALIKVETRCPFTYIPAYAFYNCLTLSNVDLSEVTYVQDYAFYNCKLLTKVTMPKCSALGYQVFNGCSNLKEITLPLCTELNGSDFSSNTSLTTVNIPLCTIINGSAFSSCYNLKEINMPKCTSVGSLAFNNCFRLSKAVFADNCTFVEGSFNSCSELCPRPDISI